jgi:hypothetical protein
VTTWSCDKVAQLRRLVIAGRSEGEISRELNVTTRAVSTKISKLGLARLRPLRQRMQPLKPKPVAAPQLGHPRLLDARDNQCRWIVGETCGADTRICGKPILIGSWCAHHNSVGHLDRNELRRRHA